MARPVDVVYAAIEPCRCIYGAERDGCIVHGELPMSYDHHLALAAIDALAFEALKRAAEGQGRIEELQWMALHEWLRGEN